MSYNLSRDYARLWELATAGTQVACLADYTGGGETVFRDVCEVCLLRNNSVTIAARGHCYVHASNEADFISRCEVKHVEFLDPEPPEVVCDALEEAIEHFDVLSTPPALINPERAERVAQQLEKYASIRDGLKRLRGLLKMEKDKEFKKEKKSEVKS